LGSGTRALDLETDLGLTRTLTNLDLNGDGIPDIPAFAVPLIAGVYSAPNINPAVITTDSDFTEEIETYAIFTDLTWEFADRWTLYGGFRYDVEQTKGTNETLVRVISDLPSTDPADYPATFAPFIPVIAGINTLFVTDAQRASAPFNEFESDEFGGFLPKLGIGYDIDDDKSLSFSVQRGYRSGGVGINAAQASAFEFDQEFIWNYELAFRSQWMEDALTLNANAFYVDWTDQQVRVQLSDNIFDTEVTNAGASSITGFEVEASYLATDTLDIYGSLGYAKTEFDEFLIDVNSANAASLSNCTANAAGSGAAFTCDFAGNEFGLAPKWTLNAGATWQPTENWIANINANHVSSAFIRGDRPQVSRDADERTLVNFRAGWQNENFGIYLTGQNLFDDEYVITQFPNDPLTGDTPNFAQFGEPRTFSLQLEARF
ncbi:MAG: TonB-dependent receptor, partial [Pseudomonadota bacterium]